MNNVITGSIIASVLFVSFVVAFIKRESRNRKKREEDEARLERELQRQRHRDYENRRVSLDFIPPSRPTTRAIPPAPYKPLDDSEERRRKRDLEDNASPIFDSLALSSLFSSDSSSSSIDSSPSSDIGGDSDFSGGGGDFGGGGASGGWDD